MRGKEMNRGSGSQQRPGLWKVFLKGQKMERKRWLGTEDFESGTVLGFGVTSRAGTVGHIVTHCSFVEQAVLHFQLSSVDVIESTSKIASRCRSVCKHVHSICSVALKWTSVVLEVGCFVFALVDFSSNRSPLLKSLRYVRLLKCYWQMFTVINHVSFSW